MKVGGGCSIQPGVTFDYSHWCLIRIGDNVTIATQVYLLEHDASSKNLIGYTRVGSINIEDNVFIGARALIMPGVIIGEGSIVSANSVVTKSIESRTIVVGNPAKAICTLDEYKEKILLLLNDSVKYDESYTVHGKIRNRNKMYKELVNKIGFFK